MPFTNTAWVPIRLCKLQKKGCTRLAAASDKVYQLLAHDRWFSPGTPTSSTTKTGRHKIAENIAESGVKHNQSINQSIKSINFLITRSNRFSHCPQGWMSLNYYNTFINTFKYFRRTRVLFATIFNMLGV